MTWPFSKRNTKENNNPESTLDMNKEIEYSYQKLCKTSSEEIANTISTMTKVHSKEYITNLLNIAAERNNLELADVICTQQADRENNDSLERKHILQEKFNNMFDLVYWWGYRWNIFEMEKFFENLKEECICAKDFKTAKKCAKVVQDIGSRGKDMLYDIRQAALEKKPRWKNFKND